MLASVTQRKFSRFVPPLAKAGRLVFGLCSMLNPYDYPFFLFSFFFFCSGSISLLELTSCGAFAAELKSSTIQVSRCELSKEPLWTGRVSSKPDLDELLADGAWRQHAAFRNDARDILRRLQ